MILACPSCDARYTVAAAAVPPEGRTVRCAACSHSWRAMPGDDSDIEEPMALADAAPALAAASAGPAAVPPPPAPPLPQRFRAQAHQARAARQAMAAGMVWAMLGAAFLLLLGGAALFRVQVVRLIPAAAGAYAAVKLPVNPIGLTLETVEGAAGLREGRAVLVITGRQRNIEAAARHAPALKVSLLDKNGRTVATQTLAPAPHAIAPGETRPFEAVFENPPFSAAEFQVDFDFTRAATPAPSAAVRPPILRVSRLEPTPSLIRQAAPLPADSPYALAPQSQHGRHDPGHHP
jgi:predicted Zn finger-like uncharacterized protein